jgi:uncharacterized LabA/DUF88 family protein
MNMFRRKIKSALFIDFDNVVSLLTREFASSIPKWLAWLEDGRFDQDNRKRTLLQKRVYWNSPNEVHRSAFEREGFDAVMCPSRVRVNKSAADVMIALDALQSTYEAPDIQEYIILTTDTDFVPLLEKLADRSKKTVAAANEKNLSLSVYSDHADFVIPMFSLKEAMEYERRSGPFRDLLRRKPGAAGSARIKVATATPTRVGSHATQTPAFDLNVAAEHLAKVAERTPGLAIGKKTVARALTNRIPEFTTSGPSSYLGCGSYNRMLERLAEGRDELQIHKYKNGGIAIVYRGPSEPPPTAAPAQVAATISE